MNSNLADGSEKLEIVLFPGVLAGAGSGKRYSTRRHENAMLPSNRGGSVTLDRALRRFEDVF